MRKRNLDLTKIYKLVEIGYNSMENGGSGVCMDCGKAICKYAIITDGENTWVVGLDCLKKLLKTSEIIVDIDLEGIKNSELTITQFIRFDKEVKEFCKGDKLNGIAPMYKKNNIEKWGIEKTPKYTNYFSFYYCLDGYKPYNSNIKLNMKTNNELFTLLVEKHYKILPYPF